MPGATDYVDGTYLRQNPDWHVCDSPWKVEQISRILERNQLKPATVFDVACGAGEVLRILQEKLGSQCELWGTDVSPQALELCRARGNEKLHFVPYEADAISQKVFDLVIAIDVVAHVEDYRAFLRTLKSAGEYKLLHIPLDLSAQHLLREKSMARCREAHPHLHYFSRRTIMFALEDLRYEVVDWCYTPRNLDLPKHLGSKLLRFPRKALFAVSPNLAANILGGYSLMVLAK